MADLTGSRGIYDYNFPSQQIWTKKATPQSQTSFSTFADQWTPI